MVHIKIQTTLYPVVFVKLGQSKRASIIYCKYVHKICVHNAISWLCKIAKLYWKYIQCKLGVEASELQCISWRCVASFCSIPGPMVDWLQFDVYLDFHHEVVHCTPMLSQCLLLRCSFSNIVHSFTQCLVFWQRPNSGVIQVKPYLLWHHSVCIWVQPTLFSSQTAWEWSYTLTETVIQCYGIGYSYPWYTNCLRPNIWSYRYL